MGINEAEKRDKKDARNAAARSDRAENKHLLINKAVKSRRVDVIRRAQAENRRTKEWNEMEEGLERWFATQRSKYWRESVPGDRPVYCANDYLKLFKGYCTQRVVKDWRQGWGRINLEAGEYGSMLSYFWGFTPFSELRFTGNPSNLLNNESKYRQRRSESIPTAKRTKLLRGSDCVCRICGKTKEPRSLIIVSLAKATEVSLDAITDLQCRSCFAKNLPAKKRWRFTEPKG